MARITWSRRALANLNAIFVYLYDANPDAAAAVFLNVRDAAASLDLMPDRGRPVGGDRRELTHVRPYVIRYRVKGNRVEILEVRHGARRPA
ncbi:MAG: type II toxin-antitoxin system RelE/ParE family toxin [Caulobacter sp.]|nr:type II toxin-antitoxin system RelE/ParE family toxin [Caulobacter sp.]